VTQARLRSEGISEAMCVRQRKCFDHAHLHSKMRDKNIKTKLAILGDTRAFPDNCVTDDRCRSLQGLSRRCLPMRRPLRRGVMSEYRSRRRGAGLGPSEVDPQRNHGDRKFHLPGFVCADVKLYATTLESDKARPCLSVPHGPSRIPSSGILLADAVLLFRATSESSPTGHLCDRRTALNACFGKTAESAFRPSVMHTFLLE
jgi:hypothetical protein